MAAAYIAPGQRLALPQVSVKATFFIPAAFPGMGRLPDFVLVCCCCPSAWFWHFPSSPGNACAFSLFFLLLPPSSARCAIPRPGAPFLPRSPCRIVSKPGHFLLLTAKTPSLSSFVLYFPKSGNAVVSRVSLAESRDLTCKDIGFCWWMTINSCERPSRIF